MKLGAQLYTIREQCKTEEDLSASLEKIAEIGYEYVQLSGFPYDPVKTKARCDELGLKIRLTHNSAERITGDTDRLIEEHRIMECPNIGIGGFFCGEHTPDGVKKFADDFIPAMEKIKAAGMKFQYHNHGFEFERFGGKTMLTLLTELIPADLMGFTLDTYWVQYGGADVCDTIASLAGRINVFHYKDMAMCDNKQRFAPIGSGNLPWKKIYAAFEKAGAEIGFVEQDDCFGADPFECLASSYKFITENLK